MIPKTPKSRYADHIKEWEELSASLAAIASELPHLDPQRAALDKFLGEARALTQQQANFQSGKQKTSVELRQVMSEGMKVATVLRVTLKQLYGNRSDDLVKFGIQPFRGRKAKPAPEPTPDPTPSAE